MAMQAGGNGERAGGAVSISPVLFVRDVARAAAHYQSVLGFEIDFMYGAPTCFAAVSRGGFRVYLREVKTPNFAELASREDALIVAMIEVSDVRALFEELVAFGAEIVQPLTSYDWGGTDFHVRDPDGNVLSFVTID